MRPARSLLLLTAPLVLVASACSLLSGLSDLREDDCALGCRDGGEELAIDVGRESVARCGDLGESCCAGRCNAPFACQADLTCGCGSLRACNGSCVNEQNDPANCGGCDVPCEAGLHQTATCSSAQCGAACSPGFASCDGGAGCPVDLSRDPSNCGACGYACSVKGAVCADAGCACPAGTTACGASCVDTSTDSQNCGACDHDCLAGGCSGGACQPFSIAHGLGSPVGIALDVGHVYYTASGQVGQVALDGSSAIVLATNLSSPLGIAVDASNVYFTNAGDGSVMRLALGGDAGSAPVPLAQGQPSPSWVVSNGASVFFTTCANSGGLMEVAVTGGAVAQVGASERCPWGVASDGSQVFWGQNWHSSAIWAAPESPDAGGAAAMVVSGQQSCWMVAVDAQYLYWITNQGSGDVYRADKSGANVVTLAQNQGSPQAIAVDATYVYWTNDYGGAVMRVPKIGGMPQVLAHDVSPRQIAVDATAVYWASSGTGAIMKLAK